MVEILRWPNGVPIRVRRNYDPDKEYPVAVLPPDLPCYGVLDDVGDTHLWSFGDYRLQDSYASPTSNHYGAFTFQARSPEIEEPFMVIDRRKEESFHPISEIWEIRGAVRRLGLEFVDPE